MQLQEWYRSVPVITRAYMTACVLTTIAVHLDLVSTFDLYLNYHAIFKHYEVRSSLFYPSLPLDHFELVH